MRFTNVGIAGVFLVEIEEHADERGFFARTWCEREASEHGLPGRMVQSSISFNKKKGTLRGLHYQAPPSAEGKLVRSSRGAIFDVVVDLRPSSDTFLQHYSAVLNAEARNALFIPPGLAHGFQTLEDDTEVFYQMTDVYQPDCARGVRWNDPAFGIQWPDDRRIIIERDASYPDFQDSTVDELRGL